MECRRETKGLRMTDKKVTVIIPNYNGLKFMEPCFAALKRQDCREFEILAVDNGSEDGSVQWLKEHGIPTIFLQENTGFPGAVNVGIRASSTPYVLLLNNDTEVTPSFIRVLVEAIERSPKIFAVSSKMVQMYQKELVDSAGDMYSVMGWAYQRGAGQSVDLYNREREVFSACAGAAIYRREVFEEIGYFDEMHFAYLEDIDVSYRAKIHGYHIRYCPGAVVYHVGSGTSGSKYNSFKVRMAVRNNLYLNYKNMPALQMIVNALPLLAGVAVKYLFFKKRGFEKDYVDAFKEGMRTLSQCKKVPYNPDHLRNYLSIQWELMGGTLLYVFEFLRRQYRKITIN